jgi:hypothetical protein
MSAYSFKDRSRTALSHATNRRARVFGHNAATKLVSLVPWGAGPSHHGSLVDDHATHIHPQVLLLSRVRTRGSEHETL